MSNTGIIKTWDPEKTQLVQLNGEEGGGGGGGAGGKEKPPYILNPTQKKKSPKKPTGNEPSKAPGHQPTNPQGSPSENGPGGKQKGTRGDPQEDPSGDPDGGVIITDISDLTPEQQAAAREFFEELARNSDKHIELELTEEEKRDTINRVLVNREKAKELEARLSPGGKTVSNQWGRTAEKVVLHKNVINWKSRLRKFLSPWIAKKQTPTYTKINRRDLQITSTPPEIIRQGTTNFKSSNKLKIMVTVDTSGSVGEAMYNAFMSELRGIFTSSVLTATNIEVRVIFWCGVITQDYLITDRTFVNIFKTMQRNATGDTNFDAVKRYIVSKHYNPVAIVHFTDGAIDISEDMMFRERGCKNIAVLPEGFESEIKVLKKYMDEVIPMVNYTAKKG